MDVKHKNSVLFVCLGNTCRSPIAEAVFLKVLKDKGVAHEWLVDSAAIAPWHVGSSPNPRALLVLKSKNIKTRHRARQIQESDFNKFEYILGMDEKNLSDLKRLAPAGSKAKLELLGTYDPAGELIIDDPYFTIGKKFYKTLEHCTRSCEGFFYAKNTERS